MRGNRRVNGNVIRGSDNVSSVFPVCLDARDC